MTSNLPERVEWIDAEIVEDEPPPKPVCWWRCGPNVRGPETASQRGVEATILTLKRVRLSQGDYHVVLESGVNVEDWRFLDNPLGGTKVIDLLCFEPPMMSEPVDWQRITYWNDRRHPGENQDRWRWDFDGPEVFR